MSSNSPTLQKNSHPILRVVLPLGPYTCLRTVKSRSIAMLSFHLKRLQESAEATGLEDSVRQEGRHSLEKRTVDAISKMMEAFLAGTILIRQR